MVKDSPLWFVTLITRVNGLYKPIYNRVLHCMHDVVGELVEQTSLLSSSDPHKLIFYLAHILQLYLEALTWQGRQKNGLLTRIYIFPVPLAQRHCTTPDRQKWWPARLRSNPQCCVLLVFFLWDLVTDVDSLPCILSPYS